MYVSTVNFNDACGPRLTRLPTSLTKVTQNIDFPFFRPAAEKFFHLMVRGQTSQVFSPPPRNGCFNCNSVFFDLSQSSFHIPLSIPGVWREEFISKNHSRGFVLAPPPLSWLTWPLQYFTVLSFILQYLPVHISENLVLLII